MKMEATLDRNKPFILTVEITVRKTHCSPGITKNFQDDIHTYVSTNYYLTVVETFVCLHDL